MRPSMKTRLIHLSVLLLVSFMASAQFKSQGTTTNYAGGTITGDRYATEVSTSQFSGNAQSENFGIYLGFASFNMESGVVTVSANSGGNVISDNVEGILLRIESEGNYDTLDVLTSQGGSFSFNPVFLGNYLVNVDSDPEKFVATYYGDAFLWEEADILAVEADTTVQIIMEVVPPELTANDGDGNVSGIIEEDFEEDEARINARRRASKRKCGLRRKRSGGRTGQNDEFVLIAYGETNDQGEFEYGFLPEGTYRFFVEYPGIPLDEASFVQFDIGEAGVSDNTFVLAAFVTEEGITVELVLGLTSEFFTNFNIYPNPTVNTLHIDYDKIISGSMTMDMVDMNGKVLIREELRQGENGQLKLNLEEYDNGLYLLKFLDNQTGKIALTFRVLKK